MSSLPKEFDLSDKEGEIIQVYLTSRKKDAPMIVTTADSEAKKHGQDGLFPVCSRKCSEKLKAVLAKEIAKNKKFPDV